VAVSKRKKFFIFRQGDMAAADSVAEKLQQQKIATNYERIYSVMSDEEIEDEFGAATYLATKEEKTVFKKLDALGRRSFLVEFWQKRDQTPETPQNEFRDNYIKLMNTANEQFSGFDKGWKSDMGRVLLLYGVPDEIERFPYSSDNKPYQIWKYFSIQGGVNFYFVDKRNFGKFELVNSTARGELYDPEWERWINPNY
jgi:GWxTD domain-containing protein